MVLGLLCAAIVFEGTARLGLRSQTVFRKIGGNAEALNRLRWVVGHENPHKVLLSFDEFNSQRGWAMVPNIRNMSVFGGKILNSNSRGVRGTIEYAESPPPGKQRIVVIGDSFTFGEEVSDDETYSHYLETLLPNTEVINLGVHGYGHDQMLLYLQDEGVKYHPAVVLVGFMWFDMFRNVPAFTFYAKPQFTLRNGKLVLTHVPVPPPEQVLHDEIYRLKFLDVLQIAMQKVRSLVGLEEKNAHTITAAIFDEIVATSKRIGATPAFVYMPDGVEITNRYPDMTANERFLSQYCATRQATCLFLRPDFMEARKKGADRGVAVNKENHWKPYQHMIAARALERFLLEKGLVHAPANLE